MNELLTNTLAAGGGGGGGLLSKASTFGGAVYLGLTTLSLSHVAVTRVRKGRKAAAEELHELEKEYTL